MEIFANSSKNIINLITEYQNKNIGKNEFNKKILVSTIFNHYFFTKDAKTEKKIKDEQNKLYQSFFKLEYKTEQSEKQLFANLRDKKGKKMLEESIKSNREKLIKNLSSKKNMNIFLEQTYNTYIPPKNISLSMNFQSNTNNNYNKKYIPDSNIQIQYLNPTQNGKENKLMQEDFIEPPFFQDFEFDLNLNSIKSEENNEENNENNIELELDNNINNPKNENDKFINLIEEDDEILFYEEKLKPGEDQKKINDWSDKLKNNDMISDFQYLKQKNKILSEQVNDLYYTLQQNKIIKSEISHYLKTSEIMYEKISQQDHFHEFSQYLTEKIYKSYLKKMNYNYILLMLLFYFDFEQMVNSYHGIINSNQTMSIFVKKMILFVGISNSKVYEPIIHSISNKKENFSFEDFMNCFIPIFELSEKYQYYKYGFLLFLVKKKGENVITLSNFRIFCNMIRGKLIYEEDICEDIIGKLIPIIKTKYPKDDPDNLNYKHVTIILEFLVNYIYGG